MKLIQTSFLVAIAVVSSVVILTGYFFDVPILTELHELFLQWAMLLVGISILAGLINLVLVHFKKIKTRQPGLIFSLAIILSIILTVVFLGHAGSISQQSVWIFEYIQIPIASSLVAVFSIVLTSSTLRLFRRGFNLFSVVFIITVLISIFGSITFIEKSIPVLSELRKWIIEIPAVGGARGLLFGIALGSLTTGIRIIIAADRPYER